MPRLYVLLLPIALASGCATSAPTITPHNAFMARFTELCGQAFAGTITASAPVGADADMAGQPLIMHVRRCSADRIEIPFHVGSDRSRTWVITRTATGLRLKHDHRHADGSSDAVTMYGGDTVDTGTDTRQSFPVDAESIANFRANGLDRSVTNMWSLEIDDREFNYELTRPAGPTARQFRVTFDLNRPVPVPPPPWGSETR